MLVVSEQVLMVSFETLTTLDSIKDPSGKDIRNTIFQTMFTKLPEESELLVNELRPVLMNVGRNVTKGDDGAEKVAKKVLVT